MLKLFLLIKTWHHYIDLASTQKWFKENDQDNWDFKFKEPNLLAKEFKKNK